MQQADNMEANQEATNLLGLQTQWAMFIQMNGLSLKSISCNASVSDIKSDRKMATDPTTGMSDTNAAV